jgi:hypothetical protein
MGTAPQSQPNLSRLALRPVKVALPLRAVYKVVAPSASEGFFIAWAEQFLGSAAAGRADEPIPESPVIGLRCFDEKSLSPRLGVTRRAQQGDRCEFSICGGSRPQSEGGKTVILGASTPADHALPSQTGEIGDLDDVAVFNEAFAHE